MKRILSFVAVIIFFVSSGFAQDNNTSSSSGFEFDRSLGGFIYIDPLTQTIGSLELPTESSLDINKYILGSGDIISISITSTEPILLRGLLINPEGKIVAPVLGQVELENLTLLEAEEKVKDRALEFFNELEVDITLEKPRQFTVFINGDVPYAGKHLLQPFTRLDEAIYPSIKPIAFNPVTNESEVFKSTSDLLNSGNYTFRNILVLRDNDTLSFDLYAFFKAGDLSNNPFVRDGDQIIILKQDRSSPKISISGAVSNSIEIEFKKYDTPQLLINLSGGLIGNANRDILNVYRFVNGEINKIQVNSDEWNTFGLKPNDRIVVPRTGNYNDNSVAHIFGEVNLPGTFPIISGTTSANDLINFANGITPKALTSAAYLVRGQYIENQVANEFNLESMKRTSDQIEQGFSYLEMETRYSQNRVHLDINNEKELDNIKLYNGDRLFIPLDEQTIFVFGQVNMSGFFPYDPSLSISNYINRAGGYALTADQNRVFILKAGNNTWYKPSQTSLESGDKIFVDRKPFDELNALRTYEIQKAQERNTRIQLIMTGLTTITGIITTYLAIENFRGN